MQKMGYGNQPTLPITRYTYNTHIHIVSVCVDEEGRKINDSFEHRRSMTACRELEIDFGLRNGADMEERNQKAEMKKVDATQGDVRHQIGNTLKAVLENYRFQTFGEYSALLSTLNIEAKQVRGEFKGEPYTGIIYSATDNSGKVVSPPFKSSRFGKRFGNESLKKRMLSHTRDFKDGKWAPAIHAQVVYAMRHARSREELAGLLKKARIDAVFRENEQGRIYGVTFIDHNRREVFNGSRMGKEFSANIYNELFKCGTHTCHRTFRTYRHRTMAAPFAQGGTGKRIGTGGRHILHGNKSGGLRGGGPCTPDEEKEKSETKVSRYLR